RAGRANRTGRPRGTLLELLLLRISQSLIKLAVDLLLKRLQLFLLFRGQLERVLCERGYDLVGWRGPARSSPREPTLGRIHIFPDNFLVRRDLEDRTVGSRTDLGVSIGESMSPRDE